MGNQIAYDFRHVYIDPNLSKRTGENITKFKAEADSVEQYERFEYYTLWWYE